MEKYLPIIYVRGYAGSQGAVESTVDRPYYGFNIGSTRVRTGPDGAPDFFIFESPLVRLIKDHGYADLFARIDNGDAVELLNGEDEMYETGGFPVRSLWIFRYYDRTSERAWDDTRKKRGLSPIFLIDYQRRLCQEIGNDNCNEPMNCTSVALR